MCSKLYDFRCVFCGLPFRGIHIHSLHFFLSIENTPPAARQEAYFLVHFVRLLFSQFVVK